MHKDFADWYRLIDVEPTDDVLQKRWAGVEAAANDLNSGRACDIGRIFFGLPTKDSGALDAYREHFKMADSAFPMRDNAAEIQMLSGATLVASLSHEQTSVGDLAALVLVCGDFRGLRKIERLREVVLLGRGHLLKRSAGLRAPNPIGPPRPPGIALEDAIQKLDESIAANTANAVGTAIKQPLEELLVFARRTAGEFADLARAKDLLAEESQMFWWVFSEYSRELNKPLKVLPLDSVCLLLGKELSDLTLQIPGPVAVPALLDKALVGVEPKLREHVSLSDAVNGLPVEFKQRWAGEADASVDDLCPVTYAVRKAVDAGGSLSIQNLAKQCGIRGIGKIPPMQLAWQTYEERLLSRLSRAEK